MKDLIEITEMMPVLEQIMESAFPPMVRDLLDKSLIFRTEIFGNDELVDFAKVLLEKDHFRLPLPYCAFSYKQRDRAILVLCSEVCEEPYEIGFFTFFRTEEFLDGFTWMPSGFVRFGQRLEDGMAWPVFDDLKFNNAVPSEFRESRDERDKFYQHWTRVGWSFLLSAVASLSSHDVIVEDVDAPAKLNRARAKKGLPPLPSHRTVKIDPTAKSRLRMSSLTEDGDRLPVRLHWRRGHFRTLPNGKEVPVRPCIVGSAAAGVVSKDYLIKERPAT